jgi:cytosine/adenosine deaminase-related metal-dependent hydrolase
MVAGAAPFAPAILSAHSARVESPSARPLPRQRTWLIKNATIYTVDPQSSVIENGAIAIQDGTITAIGKTSDIALPPNAQTIDARGHMVVPGFVNLHWHDTGVLRLLELKGPIDYKNVTASSFSNGGDMVTLVKHFRNWFDWNFVLSPEEAYALSFFALMNQLRTGTTLVGDVGSINNWDGMARAMIALGMRGGPSVCGVDTMLDASTGKPSQMYPAERVLGATDEMLKRWAREPTGLVRAQPSLILPLSSSDQLIKGLHELAIKYDVPFVMHAAVLRNEDLVSKQFFGEGSIERLERAQALSSRLTLAHASFITDAERDLLLSKGVNLTHSPAKYGVRGESTVSETKQFAKYSKKGGNLSVSTDGGVAEYGSMIQALRFGYMMNNEANADDSTFTPTGALAMATIAGARAAGRENEIGSLEVGKQADIAVIRADDWRYVAVRRPLSQFLNNGGHADVARVFVDGRQLVVDGKLVGVDEEHARWAYLKAAQSISKRLFNEDIPLPA